MENDKFNYRQYAAFINRQKELEDLRIFIDKEPSEILFIHGPKSSGKTTLLYKLLDQLEKEQKLDVKFLNLREVSAEFSDDYNYKDFLHMLFNVEDKSDRKGKLSAGINVGFFKIDSEIERKIQEGRVDPFKVMKREFIRLREKVIEPILIIDELQALDKAYMNNGRDQRLIIKLFNFFVAVTKESHLAHVIISSSDGYFINQVFTDSRLKKASKFYKVDYLPQEDVNEWLLNLGKYSRIKDYTLTKEEANKIWEMVGGSMWEIQDILSDLFSSPLDEVLAGYKRKMVGIITDYIVTKGRKKREKILSHFTNYDQLLKKDINEDDEELLRDMVRNNILYFDPIEAIYYPQGESYKWGIRLYFESIS
jgi:AAA+ ATPase superfamily predicted ATPase